MDLGNPLEGDASAYLIANFRVFLMRPGFAGILGQKFLRPFTLCLKFERAHGSVHCSYRLRMLIKVIGR
jgi:hypothetical protein